MIEVIETCSNLKGLCALSPSKDVCILGCPDKNIGVVRVVHFDQGSKTLMVNAHQSSVSGLSLNNDGSIMGTASDKVRNLLRYRGR
jgi:hypothetical protein